MNGDELIDKLGALRKLIVAARNVVANFPKAPIESLAVHDGKTNWIECGSHNAEELRHPVEELEK